MQLQRFVIALLLISVGCDATSVQMANFVNRRQQKLIEGSMDIDVDPCEDFYEYACGNWEEYTDGAGYQFAETLSMMDFRANQDFMDYMNRLQIWKAPRFVRKTYEFYRSCLDVGIYSPQSYLNWLLENEQLKMPSLFPAEKNEELYDWISILATMYKYGMNGIFLELTAFYPKENPSQLTIDLDKPLQAEEGLGFIPLTQKNLKDIIRSIDGVMTSGEFLQLWSDVSKFEQRLLQLKEELVDLNESEKIELKKLPLEWLEKYLRTALNQTITDSQIELYIQNVPYLRALDEYLKNHESVFIAQYLEIRFVWYMRRQRPPIFTPEGCIVPTRGHLSLAMHWIYEQQKPHIAEVVPEIQKIFENIIKTFKSHLQKNENAFNASTLQFLLSKLDKLQLKVGNLPRWNTTDILEDYYHGLNISRTDFYGNHLKLLAFHVTNRKLFYTTTNSSNYYHMEEYETAASPSPYYIHKANMVMLPSTAIQRPLYHDGHEDVYKYSSLGFLLSHEMLHAFDINGLEVDGNGKLNSTPYLDMLSNSKFKHQLQCLRQLNPLVINEKISDVSGLQYAYETFFSIHPDMGEREQKRLLHGNEMSLGKLFFLNFAQFFCGSTSSFYYVNIEEHGSDRDRVNDAVKHFPEFAKVFNCSASNRMRVNQTCNLWRR
ncbi:neprilysin-1 [Musca domestica]|uniref:Neprilysin-1 n=2 Tax=Musca domestica TaxID=7370 RepID=A0A1I8ML94_MUSDO|nr:neprilysin-1 [Musca domestica]